MPRNETITEHKANFINGGYDGQLAVRVLGRNRTRVAIEANQRLRTGSGLRNPAGLKRTIWQRQKGSPFSFKEKSLVGGLTTASTLKIITALSK